MRSIVVLLMIGTALCSACTGRVDISQERADLLKADRDWASAAAEGDIQRLAGYWADDAINFFPGAPVAKGKEAILQLVRQNRSRAGFSLNWEPTEAVVSKSGDLGYTWGEFQLSIAKPDGGTIARQGHYVAIWRKQIDGSWRCEVESTIFTVESPAATS